MRQAAAALAAACIALGALGGCTGADARKVSVATTTTTSSSTTTMSTSVPAPAEPSTTIGTTPATTVVAPASASAPPADAAPTPTTNPNPFTATVATVTAADLGASWHDGCPVGPDQLRLLSFPYVGFDGAEHPGRLVVNADSVDGVLEVFRRLHEASFPMHEVKVIFTQQDQDDYETYATTGFSCRDAVNDSATPSWSQHAFGHAVDVNPVENPYIQGSTVTPAAGAAYTDRGDVRPGMAVPGGVLVDAFAAVGWGWGASFRDYQHFSVTGT